MRYSPSSCAWREVTQKSDTAVVHSNICGPTIVSSRSPTRTTRARVRRARDSDHALSPLRKSTPAGGQSLGHRPFLLRHARQVAKKLQVFAANIGDHAKAGEIICNNGANSPG